MIFNLDKFNTDDTFIKVVYSVYYFFIVTAGMIINGFINLYTTPKETIDNWKIRQEIWIFMIHVITIAISVFFLSKRLQLTQLTFENYIYSTLLTFIVGIIPLIIYTLFKHNILLSKHLKDMEVINNRLRNSIFDENELPSIILENNFIIHASGKVRIDRLDQQGIFNAEERKHTHKLRLIKSIV